LHSEIHVAIRSLTRGEDMHSSDDNYVKPFHPVDDFLTINVIGHLAIHGLDTTVLAQEYSTPAYIIGEQRVRENLRKWVRAFRHKYPRTKIFYALKADSLLAVCPILKQEGAGFGVGSEPIAGKNIGYLKT